jgi:hypothetical protein
MGALKRAAWDMTKGERGSPRHIHDCAQSWDVRAVGPSVLRDYDGMNYYAARKMGFDGFPMRKNTILVDSRMPKSRIRQTIRHEILEARKMERGEEYWPAHRYALKNER